MERASSEPVLRQEDYHLPCHGVAETGHAKRVLGGTQSKDDGKFSSRINQIIRAASKNPGPGKYVAHEDWKLGGGNKFAKSERTYKPMHKYPDPTLYERKDFALYPSNRSKDNVSSVPRVIHGKVPKGKKRSFLDQALKVGAELPGPGTYNTSQVARDRIDSKVTGASNWKKEATFGGKCAPDKSLAPNHYYINHAPREERSAIYSVPKELGKNFLDKAVKEKIVDLKSKRELPGPGTYAPVDLEKMSRGGFHMQLRGIARSSCSGYF